MATVPKDLRYTPEHEYVKTTADPATVQIGITDYAQGELGDVVFVELPKPGATFTKMQVFGTIDFDCWLRLAPQDSRLRKREGCRLDPAASAQGISSARELITS